MTLPAYIQECIDALESAGFPTYAVGGCVRDACLGLTPHDYDLCTAATPDMTAAVFSHHNLVKAGEKHYDFIEIMGCPGGCVTGGGQPIVNAKDLMYLNVKELRAKALYDEDASKALRKSHENPSVKKIYDEYFEKPGSHKSHELLHTTYVARKQYE